MPTVDYQSQWSNKVRAGWRFWQRSVSEDEEGLRGEKRKEKVKVTHCCWAPVLIHGREELELLSEGGGVREGRKNSEGVKGKMTPAL